MENLPILPSTFIYTVSKDKQKQFGILEKRSFKARGKLPTCDVAYLDTSGVGDAFWGAILHQSIKTGLDCELTEKRMTAMLQYSNAVGSLATTKHGAIPAMASDARLEVYTRGKGIAEIINTNPRIA